MTKHYAKKRHPLRAVQWLGEITSDLRELIGDHDSRVDGDRQLVFSNAKGPGRFARVGDWIYSTSGEDLSVIGNEEFLKIYEEVDETGRMLPPSDADHEAAAQDFTGKLDALLVDALRLSPGVHPGIWRDRNALLHALQCLLEDHGYVAARRELARIREKIKKELWP
jgi:hypothetical protein